MPACATQFRFFDLPPEVILNILEKTDLVTPTGVVRWDTQTKYALSLGTRPLATKGSWQAPRALFLVSKAFCAQSQQVFFSRNIIEVWPDTGSVFEPAKSREPSTTPMRCAASEFLTSALASGSLQYVRYLDFGMFGMCDRRAANEEQEDVELARRNWFQTLDRMNTLGTLESLQFIHIWGYWNEAPSWETLVTTDMSSVDIIRPFVREYIWPLLCPEGGPPLSFPRNLMVNISGSTAQLRYNLRIQGAKVPNGYEGGDWDTSCTSSRLIFWQRPESDRTKGSWVKKGQRDIWVEEVVGKEIEQL